MAKAYVDGREKTRVLLWRTEDDLWSIDRLSPEGARTFAEHLATVSTERALVERHALMLLQQHGRVGECDELDAARKWVRAVADGEAPARIPLDVAIPASSWSKAYGGASDARVAFARRVSTATIALADAIHAARVDRSPSDGDVIAGLLEATRAFTFRVTSAWAHRMEDEEDAG